MDKIKDIVHNVIGKISTHQPQTQERIQNTWDDIVGKKAKQHSRIDGLDEGTLVVNIDSSAWLFQMNIKKKSILQKMKRDNSEIKNIRFKIGKV